MPFQADGGVHFPAPTCAVCPLQAQCTSSVRGRSISIHPDERLLDELRVRQQTPDGRAKLRERIAVEHTLAHVGRWQGGRARYRGQRKNLFDLRRAAVIHNLAENRLGFESMRAVASPIALRTPSEITISRLSCIDIWTPLW
jgi:transposase